MSDPLNLRTCSVSEHGTPTHTVGCLHRRYLALAHTVRVLMAEELRAGLESTRIKTRRLPSETPSSNPLTGSFKLLPQQQQQRLSAVHDVRRPRRHLPLLPPLLDHPCGRHPQLADSCLRRRPPRGAPELLLHRHDPVLPAGRVGAPLPSPPCPSSSPMLTLTGAPVCPAVD